MYSVFKPNIIDMQEIKDFVKSSESAILKNDTVSTAPTIADPKYTGRVITQLPDNTFVKHFQQSGLVYKQTKNGEPIYLRKATDNPLYIEDGYLTLEFGLIKSYNGSKSFIYEQEFWDAWHNYLKEEGYIGWATILAESATTEAYKKAIDMGLLGDDVYYGPMRVKGRVVPGFKKIKVTF